MNQGEAFIAILTLVSIATACRRKLPDRGDGDQARPPGVVASPSEPTGGKHDATSTVASGIGVYRLGDVANDWLPDFSKVGPSKVPQDQPCFDKLYADAAKPSVIPTGFRFCVPGGRHPLIIADYNFDTDIYSERSVSVVALDPAQARADAPAILFDLVRAVPTKGTRERQYHLALIATDEVFGPSELKSGLTFLCDGLLDGTCRTSPVVVNDAETSNGWKLPLSIRFPAGVPEGTIDVEMGDKTARLTPRWFLSSNIPLPRGRPK